MNAYDRIRAALANFTRYEESDIRQLESIGKRMMNGSMYGGGIIYAIAGSIREAKAVIDEPRRNCDVGTAEEQAKRYARYCDTYLRDDRSKPCTDCPCCGRIPFGKCEFAWAQMPYEEGGAGENLDGEQV